MVNMQVGLHPPADIGGLDAQGPELRPDFLLGCGTPMHLEHHIGVGWTQWIPGGIAGVHYDHALGVLYDPGVNW